MLPLIIMIGSWAESCREFAQWTGPPQLILTARRFTRFTLAWTHAFSFYNRPLFHRLRPSGWQESRCGRGCQKQQLSNPCRSPFLGCLWHSTRYAMIFKTQRTTNISINVMLSLAELEKPGTVISMRWWRLVQSRNLQTADSVTRARLQDNTPDLELQRFPEHILTVGGLRVTPGIPHTWERKSLTF